MVACLAAVLCFACVRSESDIRTDVRERLDADQTLAGLDLSIEVKNRVVYLSGRTLTQEQQQRALSAARGRGIKLVVNHMSLTNSALIDKVKQALAADETIGKIPIDVDAEGTIATARRPRKRLSNLSSPPRTPRRFRAAGFP